MITNNVIERVFYIEIGTSSGTAFAIDHGGKQYLVTARHILGKVSTLDNIKIFHNSEWKTITAKVVGTTTDDIDIAVLSLSIQLAPTHPLRPSIVDLGYGQQVYFLGFPLGMVGGGSELNRDFPMAFAKTGVFSGMDTNKPPIKIWVDGHNCPGFSGGPLVFSPLPGKEFQVAGVISSYRISSIPVYSEQGQLIGVFPENSGIVEAHNIKFAIDLIDENPCGFELSVSP